MKGLKIRVPGSAVYMNVFKALGASPTAMSWSEVFTAIQQGTIDGQENGCSVTKSAKMDEIQQYMTIWNYSYENDLFVANSKVWNNLEEKTQQLLQECATESCEWGRDRLEAEEDELIKGFQDEGMQVEILTEDQLQAFKDAVADVTAELKQSYGEEACAAFGRVHMLEKIEKFVACVAASIMAVLVFVNVIARYVFGDSLAVSDELSTYLFVLMSFMGTAIAARRKAHLGLSIVTDRVSPRARMIINEVMYAISALFCLLIVIFGVQMVISQYQMGQETATMQWPEWIYGSFVPIGAAFAMLAFLQTMVQMYKDYQAEEGK